MCIGDLTVLHIIYVTSYTYYSSIAEGADEYTKTSDYEVRIDPRH